MYTSGADPGFQVRGGGGGGALKKIAWSGGRREKFWGISCEKTRFYAKKSYFLSNFRGGGGGGRAGRQDTIVCLYLLYICHPVIHRELQHKKKSMFKKKGGGSCPQVPVVYNTRSRESYSYN